MNKNFTSYRVFKFIVAAVVSSCMLVILFRPEIYISSAYEGIKLWAIIVLPSLLPFFFCTALLSATGITNKTAELLEKPCFFLFRTGGYAAYVFLMSVLSGYPIGAKIIGDLGENGLINKDEATKMSAFCSTSGPLFIAGSVGTGMFGSAKAGKVLLLIHILSAVTVGIIFRFIGNRIPNKNRAIHPKVCEKKNNNTLYECIFSSVVSVAVVGGFICVFYVLADIAQNSDFLFPVCKVLEFITGSAELSKAFSYGLIECTRGCKMLAECGLSAYSLTFTSMLIAFGGVSVLVQSISFLKKANVKISYFISAKAVQTLLSAIYGFVFYYIFF